MAFKRAYDELFIDGVVKTVYEIGIENTRTKDIADYAGFSEATMYRRFPSKEALLNETFLYIHRKIADVITEDKLILSHVNKKSDVNIYVIWREIYRYLVSHKEETVFLIRYRCSSYYKSGVQDTENPFSEHFTNVNTVFEKWYGTDIRSFHSVVYNYILELTLFFAMKVVTGKLPDDEETEKEIWTIVNNVARAMPGSLGKMPGEPSSHAAYMGAGK